MRTPRFRTRCGRVPVAEEEEERKVLVFYGLRLSARWKKGCKSLSEPFFVDYWAEEDDLRTEIRDDDECPVVRLSSSSSRFWAVMVLNERACADFYVSALFATFRMHFIPPSQHHNLFFVDALLTLLHCIMTSPAHPTHFYCFLTLGTGHVCESMSF